MANIPAAHMRQLTPENLDDIETVVVETDLLIIGGGISGVSIARELARQKLDILVVDKECDLALGASGRNDGEVHPGIDLGRGSIKHKYIRRGNAMYDQVCKELDVPFHRVGQYVCFQHGWLRPAVWGYCMWRKYHDGIADTELISGRELLRREPNFNKKTRFAISNPDSGCVCPYGLTIAYAENAVQNGARIALNTAVLGMGAPFENAGIVDSWGVEVGANYTARLGSVLVNAGGNFNWNRNEIKEQLEEPRQYPNLVQTGHSLDQLYGLVADGLFRDADEVAQRQQTLPQNFSTLYAGDVKYKDINGDHLIDSNDRTAIGYGTITPRIFYSFHLGAEWKGWGVDALFQGTAQYSALLNTKSLFRPLLNTTTLSSHYYDNRWTPEHPDARYPRLATQSSNNNYQTSTLWLADRSFLKLRNVEVYYRFPKSLLQKTHFIGDAKLYARGVDLLCLDHIDVTDPEAYGATNPLNKSLVVGLQIGF